jgi:O-antigen ligase
MHLYKERGMKGAFEHQLNAHNEYYQVFISLGIIGFILLLVTLYFPFIFAFRTGNTIYLLFLLIVVLNFLTESMFETQAGVMFYAFFNSLLCFSKNNKPLEADYLQIPITNNYKNN